MLVVGSQELFPALDWMFGFGILGQAFPGFFCTYGAFGHLENQLVSEVNQSRFITLWDRYSWIWRKEAGTWRQNCWFFLLIYYCCWYSMGTVVSTLMLFSYTFLLAKLSPLQSRIGPFYDAVFGQHFKDAAFGPQKGRQECLVTSENIEMNSRLWKMFLLFGSPQPAMLRDHSLPGSVGYFNVVLEIGLQEKHSILNWLLTHEIGYRICLSFVF